MAWLESSLWIDCLVSALCIPPAGKESKAGLMHLEPGLALLALAPYRELVLFLSCPKGLEPTEENVRAQLERAIAKAGELLAALDTGKMHVVWFDGQNAAAWVGHTPATWGPSARTLLCYQVDGMGDCQARAGLKDWLEDALKPLRAAGTGVIPSTEALAIARSRALALLREEQRFELVMARRPPRVTLAIVGLNLLLYGLASVWGGAGFLPTVWRMGADQGEAVWQGEVWRLVSSFWLHGGFIHLFSNLIALLLAGLFMEDVLGARRYLLLYMTAGLAGNLLSAWLHPQTVSLGASGAIFGLLAAMAVITVWPRDFLPALKRRELVMGVWTLLILDLLGSVGPDVDIAAHVGGCLAGGLLVRSGLLTWRLPRPWLEAEGNPGSSLRGGPEREPLLLSAFVSALALASVALIGGSIWLSLSTGRPWELAGRPRMVRTALANTGVSLEIPAAILEHPRIIRRGEWTNFIYGRDSFDPVVIDVSVARLERPLTTGELPGQLEAYRVELENEKPSDVLTRPKPPAVQAVGGAPMVYVDQVFREGGRMPRWVAVAGGDRHVDLELVLPDGLPAAWAALETSLMATLRVE